MLYLLLIHPPLLVLDYIAGLFMSKCIVILFLLIFGSVYSAAPVNDADLLSLLESKVVTGTRTEEDAINASLSIKIISSETISDHGYETITEVLRDVGGFFIRSDMNYDYVGVRGVERPSSYGGTMILLLNGHKINDVVFDAAFFGVENIINLDNVERIEIVKGPASSVYGTGGMLSVINVITKSPEKNSGGKLDFSYGSFGSSRLEAAYSGTLDDLSFSLSGAALSSEGPDHYYSEYDFPENNNGLAEGLDWEENIGIYSDIRYKNLELGIFWGNRSKGVPTAAWEMKFNDMAARSRDRRFFADLKYNEQLSSSLGIKSRISFDEYFFKGVYPYEYEDAVYDEYDSDLGRWIDSEVELAWDINSSNRLISGLQYQNIMVSDYIYWDEEAEYINLDMPYNIISVFLEDRWQVNSKLSILGGLRYDHYSINDNSFSPRISIVFNPMDNSAIKLIYGEAYRVPNVYELKYMDPGIAKANPALKPERNRLGEFRIEKLFSEVFFVDAGLFHSWIINFISQVEDPDDGQFQFQNSDIVSVSGLDIDMIFKVSEVLDLKSYYTYHLILDGESRVVNMPEHIYKFSVCSKPLAGLTLSANINFESERETLNGNYTDNLVLFDVFASYLFRTDNWLIKNINFSLKVHNLFDKKYSLPGSNEHLQDAIPQWGRFLRFKIGLDL